MERYNEYKDSGVQWLGEIPSHWELRKMKYTFCERSQKGFPNEPLLAATQNHGVIKKSDYENRTVEATKNLDTLKLVEEGDFVISLRSFQGGIEYSHCRGIISPAYTVLKAHHLTEPYFKHLAKSPVFINLLKSTVTGIREGQNIDYNKLKIEFLPIPTVEEQQAIACYLDTVTAKIDEAIAQQQKMIDLLNERKQITIDKVVTRGLDANIEMISTSLKWLPFIPKNWIIVKLKYLASLKGRIGWNGLKSEEFKTLSYAYLVTGQDFNGSNIAWDKCYQINKKRYDEDPFIQLSNGDLLITKDGSIGKIAKVNNLDKPACLNSGIFVLKQTKGLFVQDYLYWMLKSKVFKEFNTYNQTGATVLHLYQNVFEQMPCIIPPKDEQIQIASFLNEECENYDKAISTFQQKIELLSQRKQIIINEMVTGKVRI